MNTKAGTDVRVDYIPLLITNGKLIFRENFELGVVEARIDGEVIHSDAEYQGIATWAQQRFGLSNSQLIALYEDYKNDYDSH